MQFSKLFIIMISLVLCPFLSGMEITNNNTFNYISQDIRDINNVHQKTVIILQLAHSLPCFATNCTKIFNINAFNVNEYSVENLDAYIPVFLTTTIENHLINHHNCYYPDIKDIVKSYIEKEVKIQYLDVCVLSQCRSPLLSADSLDSLKKRIEWHIQENHPTISSNERNAYIQELGQRSIVLKLRNLHSEETNSKNRIIKKPKKFKEFEE